MNNPLVSVIVPNYCHSRFLDERIMSVLNQTYQNFELIILDDCSPDNGASKAVIEKYRNNPKVSHIVYNEVNSGSTFKQWNKGFELAKGELIWIAESDDSCEVNLLETLVNVLLNNSNIVLSYCSLVRIDENGKVIQNKNYGRFTRDFEIDGITFMKKYMLIGNIIYNASAVVFRKKTLNVMPKDYMNFKSAGDHLFWSYILMQGHISYVAAKLNKFRQHSMKVTPNSIKTGITDKEDCKIFNIISKNISLSLYRKMMVGGQCYHIVNKRDYKTGVKNEIVDMWKKTVLLNKFNYVFFRINRYCNNNIHHFINIFK